MALEYEVRPEFQSLSLGQLLDADVKCFEGVGDTQSDILNRYFSITTVRQLGNLPYFLWALGIQEIALQGGEKSGKSVDELAGGEPLKFAIREDELGKNAVELLNSAVNVLDGLTPGQNLAMYDAFRITNVIQLAHNRIMLEARVIEYLEKHPELLETGDPADKDQVASILGADTFIPTSGDEAQQALTGAKPDEKLSQMAGEMGEHLRGRLDALKERAAERVKDISSETAISGEELAEGVESSRQATAGGGTADPLESIRQQRERMETTRVQTVSGADVAGGEPVVAGGEATPAGGETTDGAEGGGGTEDATAVAAPSEGLTDGGPVHTTIRPPIDGQEGADAAVEAGADAGLAETVEAEDDGEAAEKAFKPWMAAAAVVAVVVVAGAIWLLSAGEEPPPPAPPAAEQGAAGQPTAETQPPRAEVVQPVTPPPPPPGPPIRTIHTVVEGQSLWRISRFHYQNPLLWPEIYKANDDQIEDPDLIFPNQKFKIPETQ